MFTIAAYAAIKTTTLGWNSWSPRYQGGGSEEIAAELRAHVVKLAGEIGQRDLYNNNAPGLKAAENYIVSRLKSYGYKVEIQEYKVSGTTARNITGVRTGSRIPAETVLVGAHYDTYENPGADDNASGVAGMLALARLLAVTQHGRTLKFAAFANEEPPFFYTKEMGSAVWAAAAKARGEKINAAIILEMIGYYTERPVSQRYPPLVGQFRPNKGNFIAQVSNFASRGLAGNIDREFRRSSTLPLVTITLPSFVPGADYSDHRNFWLNGYPAVMFTDTSIHRNQNYHKNSDTPETLNYGYMAGLIAGLEPALAALADGK